MKNQVLLVDDDPQVLMALEDVLSDEYEILKVTSPELALNVLEQERDVAVVISDQSMPGMTGDELLAKLTGSCDATRVMVTGYADLASVIRAVNNGRIFAYVTKPWDSAELRMTVLKCVEHFELSRRLERERQLLDDLINNIPDVIYFKDSELRFQRMNRACAARWSLSDAADAVGKRLAELGVPLKQASLMEAEEARLLDHGRTVTDVLGEQDGPEGRRFYSTTLALVRSHGTTTQGLVGISRDVTAREHTERALRRLTHVRAMLGGVNAAIVRVKDREVLTQEACRIAVEDGGLLAGAILTVDAGGSMVVSAVASGAAGDELALLFVSPGAAPQSELARSIEALVRTRRPSVVPALAVNPDCLVTSNLLKTGGKALGLFPLIIEGRVAGIFLLAAAQSDFFDSEEARLLSELADNIASACDHIEKSARLDFLAYYDELTGLPKRELLMDRVQQLLRGRLKHGGNAALLLVDVSRFRHVNDTLGRAGGDELLVQVGKRLLSATRERDTLARFDGNSFALLLTAPGDESELVAWIEKAIFEPLNKPFTVRDTEIRITARIGAAVFPSDAADADGLARNAEAALGNAKATGQPYLFYTASMNARVGARLTLETKLRRALEEEQFLLHYQPKVDLKSGRVIGLEALIRWKDPEDGLVAPAHFIPALEETGLILDVGSWLLDETARQYAAWVERGLDPPRIAVNVSAVQLSQRGFVRSVEQALEHHPAARGAIDIELTESVLMNDLGGNIDKLRALKKGGVRIAIDDFGTGYSSLGYLSRLPIDTLKIDRCFVTPMSDDPQNMTIVMTIISLAHSLDMKVIAEGVETSDQARLLKLVKCDQIQGYLVGRPQPADDVIAQFGAKKTTWPPPAE